MTVTPQTLPPLTDLQRRIIWGIEQGATLDDLSEDLGINRDTVREYERKLKRRLGCDDRVELPYAARAAWGPLYAEPTEA